MNYVNPKIKDPFLRDIALENIFVSEFMPDAPGDYVKVYIYGRYMAELGSSLSLDEMAAQMDLSREDILQAWDYWEGMEVIRKRYIDGDGNLDFTVEFINLKEQIFGGDEGVTGETTKGSSSQITPNGAFGSEALSPLMKQIESKMGRPLSVTELQTVISWIDDTKASPEVILAGVEYCIGKGKSSFRYMSAVIEGWIEQGLNTQDKIEEYLDEYDQKYVKYRRVMKALGLSRNATEEERRIMDSWFDDMGYNMTRVLEACSTTAGISNPNIKYVNTVLVNWQKDAAKEKRSVNDKVKVTNTVLKEYYDYLRDKADREAEERRKKVYSEIPEIREMDEKMRDLGIKLAKALLSRDDGEGAKLNSEMEVLNVDRAVCLVEHNYDVDYMDPKYLCPRCNDTGIAEMGGPCVCREQRRKEAEVWQSQREKEQA